MKIAIVHDWLVTYAGAERVLAEMIQCYPEADVFAVIDFLKSKERDFLNGKVVHTTWIQNLPGAHKHYQRYLPLMPWAMKSLDLRGYDLVISSSHAVAKGVSLDPNQLHVCMCYTPMRYAWDLREAYLKQAGLNTGIKGWLANTMLEKLRKWDFQTSQKVHQFIAISHYIADRIERCYGRNSVVVYPPVDVESFSIKTALADNYFITASRLVPYKNVALIVKAFSQMPDKRLKVVGTGSEFQNCQLLAGPNVEMLGFLSHAALKSEIQNAKAFVFAADEDFGIAPVEAQACGTPVIAFAKGGALETVRVEERPSGLFFQEQSETAIAQAIIDFEQQVFSAEDCRENAIRFSVANFHANFKNAIEIFWREFQASLNKRESGAMA
jgi:glycosyltransferase involved in cell wall biosynthesis